MGENRGRKYGLSASPRPPSRTGFCRRSSIQSSLSPFSGSNCSGERSCIGVCANSVIRFRSVSVSRDDIRDTCKRHFCLVIMSLVCGKPSHTPLRTVCAGCDGADRPRVAHTVAEWYYVPDHSREDTLTDSNRHGSDATRHETGRYAADNPTNLTNQRPSSGGRCPGGPMARSRAWTVPS